jgi:ABC-2 type transport system ATP-binding protein
VSNTPTSPPAAISIRGVRKTFGPKLAVDNLDLTIPQGSLYGFIGPNGAGKTTTIRMIMSILFPDSGDLSVLGKPSAVESKDRIGYLPEERGVYRKMRVGPFLTYMARLKGLEGAMVERKVREWLDRVGLKDVYRKKCEELSKGMSQKVQFIAAVIHEPDLIILDEPFSGLDPVNRRLLRGLMDEQHRAGRTLIFSTHAMFEAEQLCTHLFMIPKGKKVLDLPVNEVWARYDPHTIVVEPMDSNTDLASLGSLPGVAAFARTDRGAELRLDEATDPSFILSEAARRVALRRLELKRPSLDDIFIQLVGGDAAAQHLDQEELAVASS